MAISANKQFHNIRESLKKGAETLEPHSESARLDAELLLGMASGRDRASLYANPEALLTEKQAQVFQILLAQRAEGRPIAHLTGMREFWSLDLAVNEHTLIPRPETELLVEQTLARIPADASCRVLDLGTGSGAIAIALASERPNCKIVATDRSSGALELAKENAQRHCPGRITFYQGDWYEALPAAAGHFDFIVSNPPYIGEQETELTDAELAFEPALALYSGKDGLNAMRHIIAHARPHLSTEGWLIIEHGFAQAAAARRLLEAAIFESVDNVPDLAGHPRISYGQLGKR